VCCCLSVCPVSDVYRQHEMVTNFEQLLSNVFLPLFNATVDPQRHLNIHKFLQFVRVSLSLSLSLPVFVYVFLLYLCLLHFA